MIDEQHIQGVIQYGSLIAFFVFLGLFLLIKK